MHLSNVLKGLRAPQESGDLEGFAKALQWPPTFVSFLGGLVSLSSELQDYVEELPNLASISNASHVLQHFSSTAWSVLPSADGGVGLVYWGPQIECEIECDNSGWYYVRIGEAFREYSQMESLPFEEIAHAVSAF